MKEKYDIVEYDHGKLLTGAIFRDVDLTLINLSMLTNFI